MSSKDNKNIIGPSIMNSIHERLKIGSWKLNVETGVYTIDNVTCDILQIPHTTVLQRGKKMPFKRTEDTVLKVETGLKKTIEQGVPFDHELEFVTEKGNTIWLHVLGNSQFKDGKCTEILGVIQDISDKKSAQEAILHQNRLFDLAGQKAKLAHWYWDFQNNHFLGSKFLCEVLGIPEGAKFNLETLLKDIPSDNLAYVKEQIETNINNKTFESFYHRIICADGSERIAEVIGDIYTDSNGNITHIIGISQDVSNYKNIQAELIKKNELLAFAEQKAQIGHWQWNTITDQVFWSDHLYHIFEKEPNSNLQFSSYFNSVHPEDQPIVKLHIEDSIKKKSFDSITHRIVLEDNSIKWIQLLAEIVFNETGEVQMMMGTCQDITKSKLAQNELLNKNKLLDYAEEITKMGNWQWDLSTNNVKWSANLYRIYEHEENAPITFQTYFDYIHEEDKPKVTEKVEILLKDKSFERLVHRIVLKDGTIKTVELLGTVIVDEFGRAIEMLGTLQDISEQRAEEMKFKALLETAPNATLILDKDNIIQMINLQAERLFGYTTQELVGESIDLLIPSRYDEKRAPLRDSFYANPEIKTYNFSEDLYMYDKQKSEIPVEVTLGPLQLEGGFLLSVVVRDITAEKDYQTKILKAKEELEVLTQELTEQNQQLADFTQITSHNLRAPVSNLNSLLEIFNMTDDEEERRELFKKFESVIGNLTLTLNTLIESLTTKSDTSKEQNLVSFSEVLSKTEEIFAAEILQTKAEIKSDFSQVDSMICHKIYMESIFQNLIGNALKYRSEERNPQIEVTSEMKNGEVILKFKDNGLGIDLKRHGHKIFGLNKVFHNHPEAKGIGLFMTKTQIVAMGGTISVSSKVNEGTTFSIQFI
ncbi:PAS domain S-box protein [Zobellia alginiliquefaciens]|uniref:PAS domain S-box protein n=1 Tax=Zobellia alginiliquefaciens TaxID=3032586 RepID=UPI0023E3BE3B|nr:PAS domain S-box protein [Zobellia alginiliquefaciens]